MAKSPGPAAEPPVGESWRRPFCTFDFLICKVGMGGFQAVVLHQAFDFASQVMSGDVWKRFCLLTCKWGGCYSSSGQRPEMQISIPDAQDNCPTKDYLAPDVHSAEGEKLIECVSS